MSAQLQKFGYNTNENRPHWTFPANDNAELMKAVYTSFLSLNVDFITTNTYHYGSTLDESLQSNKEKREEYIKMFKNTCEILCQLVVQNKKKDTQILGSVGTLATMYHDLSEYHGNYIELPGSEATTSNYYSTILRIFEKETAIRNLVFETIPSEKEAEIALTVLQQFPCFKAVFSFTCKDNAQTRHGETIKEIAKKLSNHPQVFGIGINCTDSENVLPVLIQLNNYKFQHIFVYPNFGDTKFLSKESKTDGVFSEKLIRSWVEHNATVMGGCCGIEDSEMRHLRKIVDDLNFEQQANVL
ncbi:unnamed protein product [Caenorhabditis sp. 36 PRJEB53466]|nr:unnamed protein product [Caenorhabditis sp. 36 PRJEB53466]